MSIRHTRAFRQLIDGTETIALEGGTEAVKGALERREFEEAYRLEELRHSMTMALIDYLKSETPNPQPDPPHPLS